MTGIIKEQSTEITGVVIESKLGLLYAYRQSLGEKTPKNEAIVSAVESMCAVASQLQNNGCPDNRLLPEAYALAAINTAYNTEALQKAALGFNTFASKIEIKKDTLEGCNDTNLPNVVKPQTNPARTPG